MASCIPESTICGKPKELIKVLIVDDDENDRLQMSRDVDQSPDLERVGAYSSGLEALEKIPLSDSQVVLMDVRMPGKSGIEVTKQLKDVRPGLFICLISGFDNPHTAAEA